MVCVVPKAEKPARGDLRIWLTRGWPTQDLTRFPADRVQTVAGVASPIAPRMFIAVPAGKVGTLRKRAKDASIDDVRKARRALRAEGATSKRSSKEEKALRAVLAKVVALGGVTVVLRGGQVSLGRVPLDEKTLRALGRALATVPPPS